MEKNHNEMTQKRPLLISHGDKIDQAFKEAVRRDLLKHKKAGNTVAVWKNGKVALLQPDQIKVS